MRVAENWGFEVAVAVQLDFIGATLEAYDQAIEAMGLLRGGPGAPEQLFHWVTETDDGIRVVDVWESRAAFEQFLSERIRVAATEVGAAFPPEMRVFEVHNYFAGGRWRG